MSDQMDDYVMVGELALTGQVLFGNRILPIALWTWAEKKNGLLKLGLDLVTRRPFRTPHHTASDAGLLGGNSNPTPGEISLAHHDVLFLDELAEFKRGVLETMRQPLKEGQITISRAAGTVAFPAQFMLVVAMNPTLDGKMPGESRNSLREIQNYLGRISGPLLDRIDIHVGVPQMKFREISGERTGETPATIRERVVAARKRQSRPGHPQMG
jgi:magnesium chelatase family protein